MYKVHVITGLRDFFSHLQCESFEVHKEKIVKYWMPQFKATKLKL